MSLYCANAVVHGFHVPSGYSRDEYKRLITACEDLESLMQLARLAIGHALWMSDLIKSESRNLFHHHHFWLNHINGVTLLGMASDRLREFGRRIICAHLFGQEYGPETLSCESKNDLSSAIKWEDGFVRLT